MSTSYTFSGTDSYTISDVKAVMQNTYEDIIGFANKEIITYQRATNWIEDLTYMLNAKVVKFFEIQLYDKAGNRYKSYRYDVDTYGYLTTGSISGGINYFSFPDGTKAGLYAELDFSKNNASSVNEELNRRGWGVGTAMDGTRAYERSYISNNLQLKRSVISK
jgi:hypothetical protein